MAQTDQVASRPLGTVEVVGDERRKASSRLGVTVDQDEGQAGEHGSRRVGEVGAEDQQPVDVGGPHHAWHASRLEVLVDRHRVEAHSGRDRRPPRHEPTVGQPAPLRGTPCRRGPDRSGPLADVDTVRFANQTAEQLGLRHVELAGLATGSLLGTGLAPGVGPRSRKCACSRVMC